MGRETLIEEVERRERCCLSDHEEDRTGEHCCLSVREGRFAFEGETFDEGQDSWSEDRETYDR